MMTPEEFIVRAKAVHGDHFDYSQCVYRGQTIKVKIGCPVHKFIDQPPNAHLMGFGCKQCAMTALGVSKIISQEEAIARFTKVHGDRYDYSRSVISGSFGKIIIGCSIHGDFHQTAIQHWRGRGCKDCGLIAVGVIRVAKMKGRPTLKRKSNEKFIADARLIHGDLYDYSSVNYQTTHVEVDIICPKNHTFSQKPSKHLSGHGCPKCGIGRQSSKVSDRWLDSLGIPLIREYRLPEKKLRVVDGYDGDTNTVYQFHGDYFHGNPDVYNPNVINKLLGKSHGFLYQQTLERDDEIRSFGYNLIIIWENDYLQTSLKNGATKNSIYED